MAVKQFWRSKDYRKMVLGTLAEHRDILFFDTETTGLSAKNDRIIELAAIKYHLNDAGVLDETDRLHLYIRPPFLIKQEIVELTGITNEQLKDHPFEEDLAWDIYQFFNGAAVVAGHNVSFDTGMLKGFYTRNALDWNNGVIELDTLEMARDIIPKSDTPNYKLGTLAELCGFAGGVSFHSAIEDIQVTAKLFQMFFMNYWAMEDDEPAMPDSGKIQPEIREINFWEGYRGYSRIYVTTSAGSVYYDIRGHSWSGKDVDINTLDLNYIEKECWRHTGSKDAVQFARYTGRMKL